MRKINQILLMTLVVIVPFLSQAQFKSDEARKSLVRIYVRVPGADKQNICSGFLWKKNSWVVTSLHGMKAGANINVLYPGKEIRPAKIIKVMKDPDLVLLETSNSDGSALTLKGEAVPLTTFGTSQKNNMLHALGYWADASSSQVIDLKHADFDPQNLDGILPEKYKKQLVEMTFPSIHDDIYGLNGGSLLPGFSGSPVYNTDNKLVAIGDGGIEAGALNVSWSIPASNLERLEASTVSELPATMTHVPFLFSAEVTVPVGDASPQDPAQKAISEQSNEQFGVPTQSTDHYSSFTHDDLSFYQTKRRTYEEIKRTAWDTYFIEVMEKLMKFYRVKLAYDQFNFDVYQVPGDGSDANPGFVITIPAGTSLYFDNDVQMIGVDLKGMPGAEKSAFYYFKTEHHGKPKKEIIGILTQKFGKENGFEISSGKAVYVEKKGREMVRKSKLNSEWKFELFSVEGNNNITRNGQEVKFGADISMIYNEHTVFYTMSINYRDDVDKEVQGIKMMTSWVAPIDCIKKYAQNQNMCDFLTAVMKLYPSCILTTVNNTY
jgi:hypothetical protein